MEPEALATLYKIENSNWISFLFRKFNVYLFFMDIQTQSQNCMLDAHIHREHHFYLVEKSPDVIYKLYMLYIYIYS